MIVSWLGCQSSSLYFTLTSTILVCIFVEVYPKEITTIGEQIFSLYSPTWSHFCSFTFHDVADHLLFFQHKSKLIKYQEIKFSSLCPDLCKFPMMLSLSHDHRKFYLWGSSFLALVHRPNLRLTVSTAFHKGRNRGLSHERPTNFINLLLESPNIYSGTQHW